MPDDLHLNASAQNCFISSNLSSCFSPNCCSVQSITTIYGCVCTAKAEWQVQTDVESGCSMCTDTHPSHVIHYMIQKQTLPSQNNYFKHKIQMCSSQLASKTVEYKLTLTGKEITKWSLWAIWLTPVPLSQTTTFLPSLSILKQTPQTAQDSPSCQRRGLTDK